MRNERVENSLNEQIRYLHLFYLFICFIHLFQLLKVAKDSGLQSKASPNKSKHYESKTWKGLIAERKYDL